MLWGVLRKTALLSLYRKPSSAKGNARSEWLSTWHAIPPQLDQHPVGDAVSPPRCFVSRTNTYRVTEPIVTHFHDG